MKLWRVIKALEEGKRIRLVSWRPERWLQARNGGLWNEKGANVANAFDYSSFFSCDWEIFGGHRKNWKAKGDMA